MADADIESFIAQQKAKLAVERQTLNDGKMNSTDYQRQWQLHHGPGKQRKTWDAPTEVKLSPRGTLNTEAIINQVQRENAREEYERQWKHFHQKDAALSPRAPSTNAMTGGQKLDTDRIIRNVVNENYRTDDAPRRKRADADSGLKNINPVNAANSMMGKDDYRRSWEEKKNQRNNLSDPRGLDDTVAKESRLKIDKSIAQAKMDADEYRKRWEEMNGGQQFSPRVQNPGRPGGAAQLLKDDDGRRENRLKKMEIDRNREYNEFLAMKRANNSILKDQTDEFKAGTLPGNESDNVKWQQRKQRNEEYNAFLANRNQRGRFDDKKQGMRENISSLPRLNYSNSAQRRQQEEERNREYNEMLQQKAQRGGRQRGGPPADVKTGWGTPDYGDLLARQRAKEQNFRRANDIAYEADPVTRQNNANGPPSVCRSKDQGGEYFASLPIGRNTDSAQQCQKNIYSNELKMQMAEAAQARQIERKEGLLVNSNSVAAQPVTRPPVGPKADPYYAYLKNLPDYDELSPRSNAILGRRQPTSERLRNKGGLNQAITPRADRGDAGTCILDMGLFNQPRTTSLDPPAGLVYQPSTFITANSVPQLNSSVDEAYNFYASQNPLDPNYKMDVPAAPSGPKGTVPSLNLSGIGADHAGPGSRVRFQDQSRAPAQGMQFSTDEDRNKDKKQNVSEYRAELERQMAENNMKKQRAKEERERYEMKMEEEAKYYDPFGKGGGGAPMRDTQGNVISDLRQMRNDNINQLSHRGTAPPPRDIPTFTLDASPRGGAGSNSYRDDLIGPPPAQTTADGDPSHARGGHGIFGMPKTDVEKLQADKYKLDLKRQIEEKKAEEYRKKQLEKLQDEREQKILEEQRARIQREYDEEQRRNNEKKEEARRKNEEMMLAAEEKKRELERQRKEEEERRQEEIRAQKEREFQERQREEESKRGKSPPIPALRGRDGKDGGEEGEDKEDSESKPVTRSPPVPGARVARTPVADSRQDHGPYNNNRAQSADVLNQLTKLRAELRKESDRVQTMLHDQEDDVQIYDPRHVQRPPPGPIVSTKPEVDVFDTALNRNPVAVRRTPNDRANSRAVEDFNALKHKLDTDSRKQFRELYPGEPLTSDALEAQQAALLHHQEERLQYLKDRRALEDTSGLRVPGAGRDTHSSSSQLVSNSAFVEVNGIGHFPDDFEDIPRRNDSARYRRRSRIPSSPQIERIPSPDFNSRATFGSQTSLNVDKMARKNEDRLRKLRDLQGDDLSLYDPEDVLDRFMSKQGHNRPPSRNTLLDDTWMRAGSTNNKY